MFKPGYIKDGEELVITENGWIMQKVDNEPTLFIPKWQTTIDRLANGWCLQEIFSADVEKVWGFQMTTALIEYFNFEKNVFIAPDNTKLYPPFIPEDIVKTESFWRYLNVYMNGMDKFILYMISSNNGSAHLLSRLF